MARAVTAKPPAATARARKRAQAARSAAKTRAAPSANGAKKAPKRAAGKPRQASSNGAGKNGGQGSASKAGGPVAAAAKKPAQATAKGVAKAMPTGSPVGKLARTAARKVVRRVARRAVEAGSDAVRSAVEKGASASRDALGSAIQRQPPIQVSVDVAVPLNVAWEEWMFCGIVIEGIVRVENVEREGDRLIGRIAGARGGDWEAEIVDERPEESLAWRSVTGSDCAGLATFHRLSERLTRIELDLDVLPLNPAQMLSLSLHSAHRHAEADLRRFKARVEFISPDVYETDDQAKDSDPAADDADENPQDADN